jgi:hypothetical protein
VGGREVHSASFHGLGTMNIIPLYDTFKIKDRSIDIVQTVIVKSVGAYTEMEDFMQGHRFVKGILGKPCFGKTENPDSRYGLCHPNSVSISQTLYFGYTVCFERRDVWHLPQPRLSIMNYEGLSIISGTGAAICTTVVVARCNGTNYTQLGGSAWFFTSFHSESCICPHRLQLVTVNKQLHRMKSRF